MELKFLLAFASFIGFFAILNLLGMPEKYVLMSSFDLIIYSATMITTAIVCTIFSGIPCILTGVVTFFANTFVLLTSDYPIFSIILTVIGFVMVYITAKLTRGGG